MVTIIPTLLHHRGIAEPNGFTHTRVIYDGRAYLLTTSGSRYPIYNTNAIEILNQAVHGLISNKVWGVYRNGTLYFTTDDVSPTPSDGQAGDAFLKKKNGNVGIYGGEWLTHDFITGHNDVTHLWFNDTASSIDVDFLGMTPDQAGEKGLAIGKATFTPKSVYVHETTIYHREAMTYSVTLGPECDPIEDYEFKIEGGYDDYDGTYLLNGQRYVLWEGHFRPDEPNPHAEYAKNRELVLTVKCEGQSDVEVFYDWK